MRQTAAEVLDSARTASGAAEVALSLAAVRRLLLADLIDPSAAALACWRLRGKIDRLRTLRVSVDHPQSHKEG